MSEWKEDVIKYKYDPLPEEVRYTKKKQKSKSKKSDHKHNYAKCLFATTWHGQRRKVGFSDGTYCTICGRIGDRYIFNTLVSEDKNPDNLPIFWDIDFFAKYVPITKE